MDLRRYKNVARKMGQSLADNTAKYTKKASGYTKKAADQINQWRSRVSSRSQYVSKYEGREKEILQVRPGITDYSSLKFICFLLQPACFQPVSPAFTLSDVISEKKFLSGSAVLLILCIFTLPLMYVLMKYIMEAPCKYWKTLSENYGCGMRHWGSLFLVFFLSSLFVQLIGLVVMLPSHILNYANQQAHQGLLIGDPLGMPSYMATLTFATFTLCSFIEFYVSQVTLVHNYYIYGSIETKEYEKNTLH